MLIARANGRPGYFCDGRMDGQIKLFGYRIELGDLEIWSTSVFIPLTCR